MTCISSINSRTAVRSWYVKTMRTVFFLQRGGVYVPNIIFSKSCG